MTGLVTIWAGCATISFLVCDCVGALGHSVAASCGARAELRPGALAILGAAMLIARQLPNFAMSVSTLLATVLCLHRDGKGALLDARSATIAAIGALLVARAISTP